MSKGFLSREISRCDLCPQMLTLATYVEGELEGTNVEAKNQAGGPCDGPNARLVVGVAGLELDLRVGVFRMDWQAVVREVRNADPPPGVCTGVLLTEAGGLGQASILGTEGEGGVDRLNWIRLSHPSGNAQ